MTIETRTPLALLKLMQLSSAALPVGGYSYSHGLETAIELSWVNDWEQTRKWLDTQLAYGIGPLDVAVIKRIYQALDHADRERFDYWNQFMLASRETRELLFSDVEMANALKRLLKTLSIDDAALYLDNQYKRDEINSHYSFTTVFAAAAWQWDINYSDCAYGYCWSWLENQVAAATKLVPLGQSDAQKLLVALQPVVVEIVEAASSLSDEDVGSSMPGVAIASGRHQYQYSRLFRS